MNSVLDRRAQHSTRRRGSFLSRISVAAQKAFGLRITEKFGYDMQRGRLDDTVHPFEYPSRVTTSASGRFRKTGWLPGGHSRLARGRTRYVYEQGAARKSLAPSLHRRGQSLCVAGASFGMHESQSRLWGEPPCRPFAALHGISLRRTARHLPEQLGDVTAEEFWRSVNAVRPDYIRVGSDELTYDLPHHSACRDRSGSHDRRGQGR